MDGIKRSHTKAGAHAHTHIQFRRGLEARKAGVLSSCKAHTIGASAVSFLGNEDKGARATGVTLEGYKITTDVGTVLPHLKLEIEIILDMYV